MQIAKNAVVRFHYDLHNEAGQQVETSRNGEPLAYLHGHGNIIKGLEKALAGRQAGNSLSVTVAPQDAYGERRADAEQRVPIKHLLGTNKKRLQRGQIVTVNTANGHRRAVVLKVGKFNVDLDTNHPYAGQTLVFNVDIVEVRPAHDEEIAHGHAHGAGGHAH